MATNSEHNSIADTQSERDDLPDNIIETMQQIDNLTIQRKNQYEDNFMDVVNTTEKTQAIHAERRELIEPITNTEENFQQDKCTDHNNKPLPTLSNNELQEHNKTIDNSNEIDIKPKANGIEHQNGNRNGATVSKDIRDSGGGNDSNEFKINTNEDLMINVELSGK